MTDIQFWSLNHRRVLRVQQSMSNCLFRVISIKPEDAELSWISDYSVPNWTHKCSDRHAAEGELRVFARSRKLEEWGPVK